MYVGWVCGWVLVILVCVHTTVVYYCTYLLTVLRAIVSRTRGFGEGVEDGCLSVSLRDDDGHGW